MEEELAKSYAITLTRPRRRLWLGILLATLVVLGGCGYFFLTLLSPIQPGASAVEVEIDRGEGSAAIASTLSRQQVIRSPLAFRLVAFSLGLDRQLKPGRYLISPGLSLPEVVRLLARGQVQEVEFTVPEGYTIRQIAALLQKKGLVPEEDFLRAASRPYPFDFLQDLPPGPEQLEGFLYPDTYKFDEGTPPEEIILAMLQRFNQVYQEISRLKDPGLNLNTRQLVTLASIVEREAKVDAERPLIAGVFLNRLHRGMRLESCATVEYLLPAPKQVLSYQDLQIDSPYNTYKVNGLPPGPIASPGRASLLAVLKPEKSDYLYFVAKPDGTHYFSRTLAEHNQAAARFQSR